MAGFFLYIIYVLGVHLYPVIFLKLALYPRFKTPVNSKQIFLIKIS